MILSELVDQMSLKVYAGKGELKRTVSGGTVTDLLSEILARGRENHVWVTIQTHPNIIAAAAYKEISAIVLVNGRKPTAKTIELARKEKVAVFGTRLSAFEFVGRAYGLGILGT
jgi:hypothetical protein